MPLSGAGVHSGTTHLTVRAVPGVGNVFYAPHSMSGNKE